MDKRYILEANRVEIESWDELIFAIERAEDWLEAVNYNAINIWDSWSASNKPIKIVTRSQP